MAYEYLPIFMQDESTNRILKEAISCIPDKTKVYLVGGVIRSALYYHYFNL